MKLIEKFLILVILLFAFGVRPVFAQEALHQNLASIKEKVTEIQIDKITFKQSIDITDEASGRLMFIIVEVDEKGKSSKESFEYFLSTIDKNTLLRKTSGKKLMVAFSVSNNRNFIKHFKDDALVGYVSKIEILVSDADAAASLIDLIKSTIPLVKSKENDWKNSREPLNWLKTNITEVVNSPNTYSQSFDFDDSKEYLSTFSVNKLDSKGVSTKDSYEFNILDINKNDIQLKISGTNLTVSIGTKGSEKYICHTKNGELQNYCSDFEIMTNDIEQAQGIITAFTSAISLAKAISPEINSLDEALSFIRSGTVDGTFENKKIKQSFEFTGGKGTKTDFISIESDGQGKTTERHFEFYMEDIEPGSIVMKISGKKVMLQWNIRNKMKFVKESKDKVLQGFQNDFEMMSLTIESARGLIEAFKSAAKLSATKPENWESPDDALQFISGQICSMSVGTDNYTQSIVAGNSPLYYTKYIKTKTDSKGTSIEERLEFYPYLLDPASFTISSSGKWLTVKGQVMNKKSYIKVYKNDQQQNFDSEFELMANDSKQAKDIMEALKYIASNAKSVGHDFTDKDMAMTYVIENVGELKVSDKGLKQKITLTDNDPCKVVFTRNSTDASNKSTEEIFELSLSDMNKLIVELKVTSKNVEVILTCKNRDKLVKAYKNGVQQAFTSAIEIALDDVDIAAGITEALKSAIGSCEK